MPFIEDVDLLMLQDSLVNNANFSDEYSVQVFSTNKFICFDKHIALYSQVGTATLDAHVVNSSGYKNDLVFCTNMDRNIDVFVQVPDNVEQLGALGELLSRTTGTILHQTILNENTGTRQSHNSTCVHIDKLEQSFSQTLLDNFILGYQKFNNSLVNHDITNDSPLFASTLINESTWIQHSHLDQSECQASNLLENRKVMGGAMIERQYGFIPYNIPI